MLCKDCFHSSNIKGVCTKHKMRINKNSVACDSFIAADEQLVKDTRTCRTCKHHFIPGKDYPNIHYYYDYKGDYFLCKCNLDNIAHFMFKEKCKQYESEL